VEALELYRERAALEGARATIAHRQLSELRRQVEVLRSQGEWKDAELSRLRRVVESQSQELARLRGELAESRARLRQATLLEVIEAVLAAVERGSLRMSDARLSRFAAELKGMFGIDDQEPGLTMGSGPTASADALSTLSFEVVPPTARAPRITRYLGNRRSTELHDLENPTINCQLDEIRPERRVYFGTIEEAIEQDYDFCAYCFGRAMSTR
jgi:hypothetical protein